MNKLFKSIIAASVGVAMVIGVGVGLGREARAVYAEEASFVPTDFSGQGTSGSGSAISATKSGVTFACDKGYGTTQIRCYSGGKITISSSENITSIAFTFSGTYTGGLEASYTDLSTASWEKTLSSQARIMECTVTYGSGSSTPEHGTIETDPLDVAEALEIIDDLADGATTTKQYYIGGYVASVIQAWSTQYNNVTYMLSDYADGSGDLLEVYRSGAADGTTGANITAGDQVLVHGKLQKYVKDSVVTPEVASGCSTAIIDDIGANPVIEIITVDNIEGNAGVQAKTVKEIHDCTSNNNTFIAKVTGVAEDLYDSTHGRFYLVNPATGDEILVYGGYTDASFQKNESIYTNVAGSELVTDSIVGHNVTVYSTISVYGGVGQLKDALVVAGDLCSAIVSASVAVNNDEMGSATISSTSIAYGSEIVVTPNPNSGYQVKSAEIQRLTHKEPLTPESNGTYKFNAETKNEVTVVFEEKASGGSVTLTKAMTEIATANSWATSAGSNVTCYTSFALDSVITISTSGSANCGSYWGSDWRLYQNKSGDVTATAATGYIIKTITYNYTPNNNGTLKNGTTDISSGTAVSVNDSAITLLVGNTGSDTNGQVRITSITVSYISNGDLTPNDYLANASSIAKIDGSATLPEKTISNVVFGNILESDTDLSDANPFALNDVTLTFEKASGSYAPKFVKSGPELRFYAKNTVTVAATGTKNITKIEFTCSSGSIGNVEADKGSFASGTWSGSATSVVFTNNNSSQVKLASIKVTTSAGEVTINSLSLTFGANVAEDDWLAIKTKWGIADYGVMLIKAEQEYTSTTFVRDLLTGAKKPEIFNKKKNGAAYADPYHAEGYYSFTVKINLPSNYNSSMVYYAAPFICVGTAEDNEYIFLNERHGSVQSLAASHDGSNLPSDALDYLSTH